MIRLTIIDASVEREWVADEFGVITFTHWCEANELPIVALVSGSIEILETDRSAVIRYASYQPDPAGGWLGDSRGPHVVRAEQPLAQRLPRHVRGRVLTEQGATDTRSPQPAADVPDEQLTL